MSHEPSSPTLRAEAPSAGTIRTRRTLSPLSPSRASLVSLEWTTNTAFCSWQISSADRPRDSSPSMVSARSSSRSTASAHSASTICFNLLLAGLLLGSPPFDMLFDPPQHALDPVCSSFHLMFLSMVRQGCRRRIATPRSLPPYHHLSACLLTALGCSRWSSGRVRPPSTNRSPGGRHALGPRAGSAPRGGLASGSPGSAARRRPRHTRQAQKGYCRRARACPPALQ